jgi:hypothetical protein
MTIERDRYLDDTGDWPISLALRSRSASTHSLLSALTQAEADRISRALVAALDEIVAVLRPKRIDEEASR